ncbi:hydroxyacylglutathione hydrolase, mitochondrial-like [Halichondria panicea]|uniref:hydroxyacylglutathione hydrolase, mitochondrial-like n=1 Tax=Halichondria panicea TaxID=6063 RepID=UPI00312B6393
MIASARRARLSSYRLGDLKKLITARLSRLHTPSRPRLHTPTLHTPSLLRAASTMSRSTVDLGHMTIKLLPALSDNYMYLLIDKSTKQAATVDPVKPEHIVSAVESEGLHLSTVLTTHHHLDHAEGNEKLVSMVTGLTVCGNDDRIGALNKTVKHNDQFKVGSLTVTCLETPCHTKGHICYYVTSEDLSDKVVFTGDTLFVGGCGRFFEGTPEQMHHALCQVLSSLPPDTGVYCGHEYTVSNLLYAQHVEPDNKALSEKLQWAKDKRERDTPTIPSTIGQELSFNPFMRVSEASVQNHCKTTDPISTMKFLREEKNGFKPKM